MVSEGSGMNKEEEILEEPQLELIVPEKPKEIPPPVIVTDEAFKKKDIYIWN